MYRYIGKFLFYHLPVPVLVKKIAGYPATPDNQPDIRQNPYFIGEQREIILQYCMVEGTQSAMSQYIGMN